MDITQLILDEHAQPRNLFETDHLLGIKPVDKNPKTWVREHAPH